MAPAVAALLAALFAADAAVSTGRHNACSLQGELQPGTSTRGTNLSPDGLGGVAAASPSACGAACCALRAGEEPCVGFTHSTSQNTATANCAAGKPCCWLKGSWDPIAGDATETAGQVTDPATVSAASIPIGVVTDVVLTDADSGLNLTAGQHATCTLGHAPGGWARVAENFTGVVLNSTSVRCHVNSSADLGGLAALGATTAAGKTVRGATLRTHARLSVSLGRQYTSNRPLLVIYRAFLTACL
jgi:hypothetical protein